MADREKYILRFIFKFVDRIFHENSVRFRKGRQIAPQASAENSFPNPPFLRFAKRSGGQKRKTSEEQKKTPAPT
jgi:hypothetical protein